MKRPLIATLIIGIFAVIAVSALQLVPQVVQFESRAANYISPTTSSTRVLPPQIQYIVMAILAFGVAALTATSLRRGKIGLVVIVLLIELAAVAWICGLYRMFFQPFPAMMA